MKSGGKKFSRNINILLTKEQRRTWAFPPDACFSVRETPEGLFLYPGDPPLSKIYIEPTTHCNLKCAACMRHSWDDPGGMMAMDTFQKLIRGLKSVKTIKRMAFWGIGEPLMHPGIVEMIQSAKKLGVQTELITNGLLLTPDLSRKIVTAGLDALFVSIDGATPASYAAIRSGAQLNDVIRAVTSLNECKRTLNRTTPEIGIEFVASRQNMDELPSLADIAREMQASFIIVSNVLPYAGDARKDILYRLCTGNTHPSPGLSGWTPKVLLPRFDHSPEILRPLAEFMLKTNSVKEVPSHPTGAAGYCPFVGKGALAVRWDGNVSPCIPLMHAHACFVLDRHKTVREHSVGSVNRETMDAIWRKDEYANFRKRVMDFDFAPCHHCDCEMAESNEEDCFGTPFPTCGDCPWAHRIVICP